MTLDEYAVLHSSLDDLADFMQDLFPFEPGLWTKILDVVGCVEAGSEIPAHNIRCMTSNYLHEIKRNWRWVGLRQSTSSYEKQVVKSSSKWVELATRKIAVVPNWLPKPPVGNWRYVLGGLIPHSNEHLGYLIWSESL